MSAVPVVDEPLPEAILLHDALSIACLGLRLILTNDAANDQDVARQTLTVIRRMLPAARKYIPVEELE